HRGLDSLLGDLAERIGSLVAQGWTILLEPSPEGFTIRGGRGVDESDPDVLQALAGRIAELQSPVAEDADTDGFPRLYGVPMQAGGGIAGVLVVVCTGPAGLSEGETRLIGLAAERASLAIDRAQVFEREHRIAETLQRSLLPERLPDLPGLEVAARYLPAPA